MNALDNPNLLAGLAECLHVHPDVLASGMIFTGLLACGFVVVRRWKDRPGMMQNVLEFLLEWLSNLIKNIIGTVGLQYLPFFAILFSFILCANLLGLFPGLHSPTANLNINAGLAISVALTAQYLRIRQHGARGYLLHFCGPPYWLAPLFIAIRIVEELVRPLSLTMRLFGNIMAKEIVLGIMVYLLTLFFFADDIYSKILLPVPLLLRPLIILLGVLVSFIQAMVFTSLTMVYVGEAVHGD